MNAIKLIRTDSSDSDFQLLVGKLDEYLATINGDTNDFFVQHNQIDLIKHVVVAYLDQVPVGCGAIKEYNESTMEVKRMFVNPKIRRMGIAKNIVHELEAWARELEYSTCILETAKSMTPAVGLYQDCGFEVFPNYGQYKNLESSVCFKKEL